MSNRAWDMLRAQFRPDGKGRFKTADVMQIAKQLAEELEVVEKIIRQKEDAERNLLKNIQAIHGKEEGLRQYNEIMERERKHREQNISD